jgi:SEC-C motif-containing protein
MKETPCDCGSGRDFAACCGPYLAGQAAPTAEALMRSRYTAYARRDEAYLLRTWHPKTRPSGLDLKKPAVRWLGLKIRSTEAGQPLDTRGVVEFVAEYQAGGPIERLEERSQFVREPGGWLYVSGAAPAAKPDIGRNEPCPCGSGKKYKRCCGRG